MDHLKFHSSCKFKDFESILHDDFVAIHMGDETTKIKHYYPYGLSISRIGGDYDEYLNKYTGKESQTGEFDPAVSTGLEMFDFHARFYYPQIGRWFTPDPAEEFHNPYLAMANNPVRYTDPDGRHSQPILYWNDEGNSTTGAGGGSPQQQSQMWTNLIYAGGAPSNNHWGNVYGLNNGGHSFFTGNDSRARGANEYGVNIGGMVTATYYDIITNDDGSISLESEDLRTFLTETIWVSVGDWDNSDLALTVGGGLFNALEKATTPNGLWLGKNGYNSNKWGGNQHTGSRSVAFKVANQYKWAGRVAIGGTLIIGGIQVYNGYQLDGGQIGYNTQSAAAEATGSIVGAWAGAEAGAVVGAAIGVWFGGVGAVPGALIGGFIGGMVGAYSGGYFGRESVNYYYRR